jgi:hypothetical protein
VYSAGSTGREDWVLRNGPFFNFIEGATVNSGSDDFVRGKDLDLRRKSFLCRMIHRPVNDPEIRNEFYNSSSNHLTKFRGKIHASSAIS